MKSYFIRHKGIAESQKLFDGGYVAIRYDAIRSIDPVEYKEKGAAAAMRRFLALAKEGGYVWAQYGDLDKVLVGVVPAGSSVEFLPDSFLKLLRLERVQPVAPGRHQSMRSAAPRGGTFVEWKTVKNRLADLVEKGASAPAWDELPAAQQQTFCAEYLRAVGVQELKLSYLLLPVGRTMKDVDIYGVASDGRLLFGQVTQSADETAIRKKIALLATHALPGRGSLTVFFSPQVSAGFHDRFRKEFPDMIFIATEAVFEWLSKQDSLVKHLFE